MKKSLIRRLLILLLLSCILIGTVLKAACANDTPILTLDRENVYYLFEIPKTHSNECLSFTWTITTDPSYIGKAAVLQFTHNGEEWTNLASDLVGADGTLSQGQPVDSGWAISGNNYLRVIIENETSATVFLNVNVGIGYWIFVVVIALSGIITVWWYFKRKNILRRPEFLKSLQSYTAALIHGKEVLLLLSIGLVIRILLAPWTEMRFDNYTSRLWGSLIYGFNLFPFEPQMPFAYPLILRYSYPPIWLYIILSIFPIWMGLSGFSFSGNPASLWQHGLDVGNFFESYRSFVPNTLPLLDFFLKLPNIMADIGIGYLLYKFAKNTKYEKASLVFWLFNPFTIQISTVWGLFDPLCAFFALCSIYFLWKERFFISATFLSLGIATKMYPLFFLIPILIFVYTKRGVINSLKYLISCIIVIALIFVTFFIFPGGLEFTYRLFAFRASPDLSVGNTFNGLTWMQFFSLFGLEINLPVFLLIFVPSYFGLNYIFLKAKRSFDSLIACLSCIMLIVFLSYSSVNPQYVIWVLPFLLYLTIKGRFSKRLYLVFSLIPLVFLFGIFNPLQFISPAVVWEEYNFQPWSDIILQLWPDIFNSVTLFFLAILFSFVCLFSLVRLIRHVRSDSLRGKND